MAFITIGAYPQYRSHLPLVIILMAGIAGVMWQRIGQTTRGMAFPAINRLVLANQLKPSPVMIEIFHRTGRAKRVFVVAFGAIAAEFIVVYIFMTTGTIAR